MKTIVEVGILLDKDLEYYEELLYKAGAENVFNCETHDLYWTNKKYDELCEMTENQIKMSCVRLRDCIGIGGSKLETKKKKEKKVYYDFHNLNLFDSQKTDRERVKEKEMKTFIEKMEKDGWYQIFDTFKVDYQYKIGDMKSRIQLQEIDNIGLVLYYDNPDYYDMPSNLQWKTLIDELNSYGFELNYNEMGIDKLRTLLFGYACGSYNQNG